MIDRDARNRLLQGIDDYMDEKMTPDEFDALLHDEIAPLTKDGIIKEVEILLFESYEDIGTNRLQSECAYWKFFNRIRLLLTSDAECRYESAQQRLSPYKWIGRLSFLAFAMLTVVSLCLQSLITFLTCGIALYFVCGVAIFISLFFGKWQEQKPSILYAQYPFELFADLLALRRSVPDFVSKRFPNKSPFPAPSRNRLIRFLWDTKCPAWVDRLGDAYVLLVAWVSGFVWLIFLWPLLVLLSFFIGDERQIRFVIPDDTREGSLHTR